MAEILNSRGEKFDLIEENNILGTKITEPSTRYQIGHFFSHQNGDNTPIYLELQREQFLSMKMDFRRLK